MGLFSGFEHIVRDNEPLAPYTWLRLGGSADYFAEPASVEELAALIRRADEERLPVRVLGGGSNVLIRETGVRGLVVCLSAAAFSQISVHGQIVSAGGGARLGHVVSTAVREGLSGLEQLVGIPGTVGGALHGNSGANGTDVGQWTHSATVMTRGGELVQRSRDELQFSYRQSSLDEPVIVRVEFALEPDSPSELTKRMQKAWIVKKSTLPQGNTNAGLPLQGRWRNQRCKFARSRGSEIRTRRRSHTLPSECQFHRGQHRHDQRRCAAAPGTPARRRCRATWRDPRDATRNLVTPASVGCQH